MSDTVTTATTAGPPATVSVTATPAPTSVTVRTNATSDTGMIDQTTTVLHKSGWRTSEFWGSLAASAVGAFIASGLYQDGSTPMRIAGMAMFVLAQMGYAISRSISKAAA